MSPPDYPSAWLRPRSFLGSPLQTACSQSTLMPGRWPFGTDFFDALVCIDSFCYCQR